MSYACHVRFLSGLVELPQFTQQTQAVRRRPREAAAAKPCSTPPPLFLGGRPPRPPLSTTNVHVLRWSSVVLRSSQAHICVRGACVPPGETALRVFAFSSL